MKDTTEFINILKTRNNQELTAKTLGELGINYYYIKVLCDKGLLEKKSRGIYKVKYVREDNLNHLRFKAFHFFKESVLNGNYDKAYYWLGELVKYQENHEYDNHMKIYAILLKELLNDKYDFSMIDEMYDFTDIRKDQEFYGYYIDFRENVLSGHYYEASRALDLYKEAELRRTGTNHVSTVVFNKLISDVTLKLEQKADSRRTVTNGVMYFNQAYVKMKNDDFDGALDDLKTALKNQEEERYQTNIKKLISLCNSLKAIRENSLSLEELDFDYSNEKNYFGVLNRALRNRDYLTALRNIGKCCYNNNSRNLEMMKMILHKMLELDKENKKKLSDKKVITKDVDFSECALNETILYNLIYDRKYEEAYKLLKFECAKKDVKVPRVYFKTFCLLNDLAKLREGEHNNYKGNYSESSDKFNHLFEALKCRDYHYAVDCINDVIKRAKNKNELNIYLMLLEDIIPLSDEVDRRMELRGSLKAITNNIKMFMIETKEFNEESLEHLEKLVIDKCQLLDELGKNCDSENIILNIISMIRDVRTFNIPGEYFENLSSDIKNYDERLMVLLNNGDYLNAHSLLHEVVWNNFKSIKYEDLLTINKLLWVFKTSLYVKVEDNKLGDEVIIDDENPLIIKLHELKKILKSRDFYGAYIYYVDNNLEGLSHEVDEEIAANILLLMHLQKEESHEIFDKFHVNCENKKFDEAYSYLTEYQEFIYGNSMNREIDYHFARLEALRKDVNTPEYEVKEKLYEEAKKAIHEKDYMKTIRLMDKYIELDHDLNAKGYLLRGRAYEYLKEYQVALWDYASSIKIMPEPNSYYRLGKLYYYSKDYNNALKYFLEYEVRRPRRSHTVSESIAYCYQKVGNLEESQKYEKVAKILKSAN